MKSTLFNMVAVLFCITVVAAAGVGGVNMLTKDTIEEAKKKAISDAVAAVVPSFNPEQGSSKVDSLLLDNMPVNVYTTADAEGNVLGYAVETMTKKGFNGVVKLMVGFSPEGEVLNISVVEQSETPGLGTQMCDKGNPLEKSFVGRIPSQMTLAVKKDVTNGDVDALTAATISSRAYTDAVARAWTAYETVTNVGEECCDDCTTENEEGCEAQEGGENE